MCRWVPHVHAPVLAVLIAAAFGPGCGFGAGPSSEGTSTLTVTRDYGTVPIVRASADDPDASETVLRFLDREAEIETRHGGGFVQAIEGVSGGIEGGRRSDWFFYVNGIESPIGSADRPVAGGDRVWWDHRDWTAAMRVPAVVGSWPEPFLQASAGAERLPVRIECAGDRTPCAGAQESLADAGVSAGVVAAGEGPEGEALRLLVGVWEDVRADPAAAQVDRGPAQSGVFAEFDSRSGRSELVALNERAEPAARLGSGAGLVAGLRAGEGQPTWIVTGVDAAGVEAAVAALDEPSLRDRYAVAVGAGSDGRLGLPAVSPSGGFRPTMGRFSPLGGSGEEIP